MYVESFASKLKKARKDSGFTQEDVAKETQIPRSTLAGYEIGRTQPDIETLGILVDFYEVSADWLLGTNSCTQIYVHSNFEQAQNEIQKLKFLK